MPCINIVARNASQRGGSRPALGGASSRHVVCHHHNNRNIMLSNNVAALVSAARKCMYVIMAACSWRIIVIMKISNIASKIGYMSIKKISGAQR